VAVTTYPAGYRTIDSTDTETARPLRIDLWYPASPSAREIALNYHSGSRGFAALDAAPVEERLPLVVLSPGSFASATSYSWTAEGLARQGFIVAAVSHFGESTVYGPPGASRPEPARLWHRPRECSAALDIVLADPRFQPIVDPARIGAIGHAAGGATAIALAGAVFDPEAMRQYCRSADARGDRACAWELAAEDGPVNEERVSRDERVRAVAAMDPARGPGHDARSLSRVKIPVLIIGAVDNDFLPFAHHAGRYARLIPGASLTPLAHGEGHFVFVDECSGGQEVRGVSPCRDRPGVLRSAVQARLLEKIGRFLGEHLAAV
jgi:predicted dienelactone hydrolase